MFSRRKPSFSSWLTMSEPRGFSPPPESSTPTLRQAFCTSAGQVCIQPSRIPGARSFANEPRQITRSEPEATSGSGAGCPPYTSRLYGSSAMTRKSCSSASFSSCSRRAAERTAPVGLW